MGRRPRLPLGLALGVASFAGALAAGPARAEEGDDGVYGRLDGDLLLVAEAGCAVSRGGPSLAVGARALYLSTAGIYARYFEGFEDGDLAAARSFSAGVELRPLFLARFASDLEHGPSRLDLLVDSLALDVGAFWWSPPEGAVTTFPGLEIGGLEVPILSHAEGPHVGALGSLRVSHGGAGAPVREDLGLRASALLLTLSWHAILDAGIVDAGDALGR